MNLRLAALLLGTTALANTLSAQLSETYGPAKVPLGGRFFACISNDGSSSLLFQAGGSFVTDGSGNIVWQEPLGQPVPLNPGDVLTSEWDLTDASGVPVPAGDYYFGGSLLHKFEVGSVDAAVTLLGAAKLGATRSVDVSSPMDPGMPFVVLAASTAVVGIPTCGGTLPVDPDALFFASLTNPAVFQNFYGVLDGQGRSTAPAIAFSSNPNLAGLNIILTVAVLDPSGTSCGVRRIGAPTQFQLF